MKQKRFDKKLVLNKQTISNLENHHMAGIRGGVVDGLNVAVNPGNVVGPAVGVEPGTNLIAAVVSENTECKTRCGTCGTCEATCYTCKSCEG
jgi:hypothetical protein